MCLINVTKVIGKFDEFHSSSCDLCYSKPSNKFTNTKSKHAILSRFKKTRRPSTVCVFCHSSTIWRCSALGHFPRQVEQKSKQISWEKKVAHGNFETFAKKILFQETKTSRRGRNETSSECLKTESTKNCTAFPKNNPFHDSIQKQTSTHQDTVFAKNKAFHI